ncbi:reticulon-4 receptor-like 1 [Sylvia borin]
MLRQGEHRTGRAPGAAGTGDSGAGPEVCLPAEVGAAPPGAPRRHRVTGAATEARAPPGERHRRERSAAGRRETGRSEGRQGRRPVPQDRGRGGSRGYRGTAGPGGSGAAAGAGGASVLVPQGEGTGNGAHRGARGVRRGSWGEPSGSATPPHPEENRSASPQQRWVGGRCPVPADAALPSLRTGGFAELLLVLLGLKVPGALGCPTDCVCYPSPMTVSCQAHNFVTIPEGIPEDSERIFLQNNQITLLLRGHFSPSMVTLWIYSNNITFIDPNTFDGFVNLEELDLGDNRYLRALAADTFQGLVKLHALYLYKCGLSSLPSGIFGGLHNLQYLYLQDNHIEFLQDDIFVDLVNLSHLFLHGNKLWSLHQNTFRGLINLDRLLIHQNQLQWIHRRAFHDLRRLTTLFLFNNSLSELQGDCLAHLGALEFLRLNGNPWSCDCKARSLWEWLHRFRGSSSSVICESPEQMHGKDLKVLRAEDFRNCSGSESLHQMKTHTFSTADRGASKSHHPHQSSKEKGKERGAENSLHSNQPAGPPGSRPGYRKPGKNCTSHKSRNRTSKPVSLGPRKNGQEVPDYVPDYQHKYSFGAMPTLSPKRKGKCTRRTPIRPPSGVQQAAGCPGLRASLLVFMVVLAAVIR